VDEPLPSGAQLGVVQPAGCPVSLLLLPQAGINRALKKVGKLLLTAKDADLIRWTWAGVPSPSVLSHPWECPCWWSGTWLPTDQQEAC
jgi:hypothetical protein